MRASFAALAFAAFAAADPAVNFAATAVSSAIQPPYSPPPGCSPNYEGTFLISPVNVSMSEKRDIESRQNSKLGITLKNGILTDPQGRTGYVASNQQFQFDDPPQAGAIWTAGFSICQNGSLSLGNSSIWYKCLSGAGSTHPGSSFYNLYHLDIGSVCIPSFFVTRPVNGSGGPAPVPASLSTKVYSTYMVPSHSSSSMMSSSSASSSGATGGGSGATGKQTGGGGGAQTTGNSQQTGGSGGSASSSSSSAGGAAEVGGFGMELAGWAAGLFAFGAML